MSHTDPPCLDCRQPIKEHVRSSKYPKGAAWSACYLCAFCRTNRYKSEAHAIARVRAAFEKHGPRPPKEPR